MSQAQPLVSSTVILSVIQSRIDKSRGISTIEIVQALKACDPVLYQHLLPKHINAELYRGEAVKSVVIRSRVGQRPLWDMKDWDKPKDKTRDQIDSDLKRDEDDKQKSAYKMHIAIDLGNIHDCLSQLDQFLLSLDEHGHFPLDLTVVAYGDAQSKGYIAKHPVKSPRITVKQITDSASKNAADVRMICECFELAILTPSISTAIDFVIVSRDQQFEYLANMVHEKGHNLSFVRSGWTELLSHLLDVV